MRVRVRVTVIVAIRIDVRVRVRVRVRVKVLATIRITFGLHVNALKQTTPSPSHYKATKTTQQHTQQHPHTKKTKYATSAEFISDRPWRPSSN